MRAAVGGEVAKIILNRVTALDGTKERALIKGLRPLGKQYLEREVPKVYFSMSGYMTICVAQQHASYNRGCAPRCKQGNTANRFVSTNLFSSLFFMPFKLMWLDKVKGTLEVFYLEPGISTPFSLSNLVQF